MAAAEAGEPDILVAHGDVEQVAKRISGGKIGHGQRLAKIGTYSERRRRPRDGIGCEQ
jgi:hypothetical protein